MFSPHVYCLQIFICVGLCMSVYLCVHDIGVCRGGSPCAYMCTFLPISLYLSHGFAIHTCMPWCSYISSSTSGWMCISVWPSSYLWARVCVSLHKSVCMRTNVFGWLSGWMHLCVHMQVFTPPCAFEDSVYGNFPYVFCYVSVPLGLCMPLWYLCPLLFACIHMTIHTRVCATVCLWRCAGLCQCGCIPFYVCVHRYACLCSRVSLCFFKYICGSPCPFTWNVFMCVNLYRSICTSFGVNTFVHLHGCESMYFSVSVYMPVSLWI